ncbi:SF3B6 factor, partial [Polypterus senegalus]
MEDNGHCRSAAGSYEHGVAENSRDGITSRKAMPRKEPRTDGTREIRLPPEVNRILYIRNLPYKITAEEMYDIFGKYGPIRQIRVGNTPETRGTAYVVYEDIFDAKNACDHLSGFNVCNRYLVVLYYNANRAFQKMDTKKKEEQLKLLKEKYGINTDPPK